MTEDQIKHMVNRFLGWKLPANFNPDNGVSFNPIAGENGPHPFKREPSGTNLFDATQATEMVRYMIDGIPARPDAGGGVRVKPLEWIERAGVTGTFDANTSIGHYVATITDDDLGMWFIVGQTTSNYMIANIGAVQRAAQADYERRILSALSTPPAAVESASSDPPDRREIVARETCSDCGYRDPCDEKCPNCNDANEYGDYEGPTCEVCGGTGRFPGRSGNQGKLRPKSAALDGGRDA